MTSRVLGLVREQILAALFGASNTMDAYVVAFRVPSLLRDLFAEGAMSAAFVPTFSRTLAHGGKARAWQLGNSVINRIKGSVNIIPSTTSAPVTTSSALSTLVASRHADALPSLVR